jgi:hypothetical protein
MAPYLEATVIAAAVAREHTGLEVFVNISQMTVSQMSLTTMTDSPQHRQHWLGEQVLNWSGLPVVHVRATVFLQHPFFYSGAGHSHDAFPVVESVRDRKFTSWRLCDEHDSRRTMFWRHADAFRCIVSRRAGRFAFPSPSNEGGQHG